MSPKPQRSVPFFNYPALFNQEEEKLTQIFVDVARRGAFIHQSDLITFERRLAEYVGAKYVLGFANATDALHLSFRAAGIGPGDEVIFASHTMVATAASVAFAGATPVAVDCGDDHMIDPAAIERAITSKTKAILPTQLNGRTCDMDAIQAICCQHGLMLLEDAAQGLGATYRGRQAGTFGMAACISFYPAKTLGCFGDGGCVITSDDEMYHKLTLLRDHGRDHSGEVCMWGMNSRLDNLQAAILNHRLDSYDECIARRREIASLYDARLRDLPELKLPAAPGSDPLRFDIFQNYELQADNRTSLARHLKERGVGTLVQWGGKAVHQFPKLGFNVSLPKTEALFERCLMLPLNTSLTDDDVHYVCDQVVSFYQSASGINRRAA